jgi:hypothetical protein
MTIRRKRSAGEDKPERVDFSEFAPPPQLADSGAWEAERARHAAEQAAYARERNLDRQPDLRVRDDVRQALVAGRALRSTPALDTVQRWHAQWAHTRPCLVVAGNPGCGKSVAAAWLIAREGGVWLRAERARRAYASSWGAELDRLNEALSTGVLVLEDVGTEQHEVAMCALLVEVLEQRKAARHRTLITTNMRQAQFVTRYSDPRLTSRTGAVDVFSESVHWRTVEGPDLRIQPKSPRKDRR